MYRRVAASIALITGVVLVLGGLGLVILGRSGGATVGAVAWYASGVLLSVPSVALGLVVAARKPTNPVGALLAFVGFAIAFVPLLETYTDAAHRRPDALALPDVVIPLSQGLWMLMYLPIALLVLFFPDGRLPSRRWRWVAWALPVDFAVFVLLAAMAPGPFAPPDENAPHVLGTLPEAVMPLAIALLLGFMGPLVASATAMVLKFRRAGGDLVRRAQLKWFAVVAFVAAAHPTAVLDQLSAPRQAGSRHDRPLRPVHHDPAGHVRGDAAPRPL